MASLAPVARLGATLEPTDMARLACLAPTLAGAAVRFATPDVSPGAPRRVAGSASLGVAGLPPRPAGPAVRLATPAVHPGWPRRLAGSASRILLSLLVGVFDDEDD